MKRMIRFLAALILLSVSGFSPLFCRAQQNPGRPEDSAGPNPASNSASTGSTPLPAREMAEPIDPENPPSKKSPLEKPPPEGGEIPDLKPDLQPPPLEKGDLRFPINLATALRLSDARPLIISATGASVWAAEAQLQRAKLLWLPRLNLGFDYTRHDGFGPDTLRGVNVPRGENALGQYDPGSFGRPLDQNVNFLYAGGAFFIMGYLTDALFQPLVARQALNAARWDVQTAKNDALLLTARAYFNVHKYRGQYAGAIYTVQRGRTLAETMNKQTRDLIPAVEVDRVRTLLADLEQQAVFARRNWRRASAELTRILRLDPRAVVEPLEDDHLQITLIDPSRSLDDLIPIGLTNRPELAAHQAIIQAALVRIRMEKARPFLPVYAFAGLQTPYEQLQFGVLGIGRGGLMNNWYFRDDISPEVMWVAESMGLGNMARIKEQRGEQSLAIAQLFQVQDNVAGEITDAQALLQSAAARVVQAEREANAALINYNGVFEGIKQTQRFKDVLYQVFRPQEIVYALMLLKVALDHYFATVAEYNQAQFELFHALGYPARELAFFRQAGEILPVDTTRPASLPPVGTGPPPPTR